LRASKSTSPHWSHKRGSDAEERVANYFLAKKFVVLKRRFRTKYAEMDLLVESPNHEIWILEIKTLSHADFLGVRVSWKQKERLKRAHLFIQSRTRKPVRLALVFVDARGGILVIEDF
jgi:Holliday junction resolvase-like predicted endonuclease